MSNAEHRRSGGAALAERALAGDRRAMARLLTWIENGHPEGQVALAKLFPMSGQGHIIGFTGSTGAGKSTLVNCVAQILRRRDMELAIVAVDPTSPFSGGALLGDRLRMRDLTNDPGVFIRSMASRGHPGGVAHATRDLITVLDALGFPIILVETVGAGQAQVEVARVAHTVVLVEAPGMGDDVQALKAGLLEIADVIVVNKADRPEADQTVRALHSLRLDQPTGHHGEPASRSGNETPEPWVTPIIETSALAGQGVEALVDAVTAHRDYLKASHRWEILRERHARAEVEAWLHRHLQALVEEHVDTAAFASAVAAVLARKESPASAARDLLEILIDAVG